MEENKIEKIKNSHIAWSDGKELKNIYMEMALGISEVFEALKKISAGDPYIRIDETSSVELISQLKHMINLTAENIGEIVDQSHEFAMSLAEHFDVLLKVSHGDLNARVSGNSTVELLESLKKVTNETIESISSALNEQKKAEESLRDIEALEFSILSAIPHAVIGLRERKIIFANESVKSVFGWKPEELIDKSTRVLYRSDKEYEEIGRSFYPVLETQRTHTEEFTCRHKDGSDILCRVSASVTGEKLEKKKIVVIYEDISARKMAENALIESEKKYRSLIENLNIGVYRNTAGEHGCFIQANPAMSKIFGYESVDEIMKIHPSDLYQNPVERERFIEKIHKDGYVKDEELKLQKKDRTPIFCSVTAKVQYSENGRIKWIDGVMEDITERKQAEEERGKLEAQLLQAQKMEAIGQLAGGIAHDFNNLLTAVIGYGNLLKSEISTDRLTSYITQILSAAERAATLTNDLLTFSRKQIINPRPVDLNKLIKEMQKLLSRIIGEDIELSTVLSDKELTTMADSTQIDQVLMNLATNARDAMPKGGSLIISTDYAQLDNDFIRAHGYGKTGPYVILSFEDTGTGIDEKIKERIFEPFFTTKDVGKGTGLGLAMVYGIIKQHNGYINLYSEPGKGTTFKLYLPLIESKAEDDQPEVFPLLKTGTETILICEDDLQVRGLMKEILEKAGYEIIEAEDGEDSIRIFNQHKDRLHLLILDVVMPKKNGKEVYDEIKKAKPDIKVVFVSGYSADIIHKKGIMEEGMEFISKPILPGDFLAKVRDVLDT